MIYSRCGWSGGKLAYLLGCSVTFPYGNENPENAWTKNKKRKGTIPRNINLGCRQKYLPPEDKNCLNINSQNSADKIGTFKAFDKMGIPHPRLISEKAIITGSTEVPKFFLGRRNKSFGGKGIRKYSLKTFKEARRSYGFKPHDFYVEFLKFKSEHRIHVFMGHDICHLNKEVKEDSSFIHTLDKGCPLIIGKIDHPGAGEMVELAVRAVNSVGLDFGAVDLFVDINDNIYVLEVNSDPGMPGAIGFIYAEEIRRKFEIVAPDYYFCNAKGGITEIPEEFFFSKPEYKRKKLKIKDEDFHYVNEGVKMEQ